MAECGANIWHLTAVERRASHERAQCVRGLGDYEFDGAVGGAFRLDDGRAAHMQHALNFAVSAATKGREMSGAGGGQGGAVWWLWDALGMEMHRGALQAQSLLVRASCCHEIDICMRAYICGEGAPCFPSSRVGVWGCLASCGKGWRGSWWGRQRRRQMVEEGRDVSGKSWGGRVMAR